MSAVEGIAKNEELRRRIFFTLGMLVIFRIGVHVPTPGVDGNAVMAFFAQQNSGLFGLFNTFTGGALERFSVFALGIMPYISSSIIFQLLQAVVPYFEALKKEGQHGQKKLTQYTRYGTVVLALIQGWGIVTFLKNSSAPGGVPLISSYYVGVVPFEVMTLMTLTAGTCFIMWLGEQITERGIGNGASLIIFAGIAAGIPSGLTNTIQLVQNGEMTAFIGFLLLAFMILVIGVIVFLETGQRRIPVQYSQRGQGRQAMAAQSSHLPLKLNFSGVIPPIFASSLLMFPATVAQFTNVAFLMNLRDSLTPTGMIYNVFFVGLIIFFCFFYTQIVFNPKDLADNLKKYGGFVPGIRAGRETSEYIQKVIDRLTVGGAIYLSIVCILPGILIAQAKVPFYFGGTSLLILVGVALDTAQQVQSHMINQKYDGMMKKVKIRGRRARF